MGKSRSGSVKDIVHEPSIEFWNIDTQFGRAGKYINHPANHQHMLILTTTQLLKREPSFNGMLPFSKCTKRSFLPFLGDVISWLTRTATIKDVRDIKKRINQLIKTQTHQQETLVHVISIWNITRYTTQVNQQHINAVLQAVERTHNDVTTLFNITSSMYTCINYQQILLHVCSIMANLRDSLYYMRQIAMHAMDYIDATTTGILSPCILSVEDLREMLMHIKASIPSTMHLPVSSDDTLHFYRYLCTHVLVAEEQFLLLIDVPLQNHTQVKIYQVFNLLIPWGNLSAQYNIDIFWWNDGNRHFRTAIHHMSTSEWTILQNQCTTSTTCQPTIMHYSYYAKNKAWITHWCSLQIRNTCSATILTPITSNLWILTSSTELDSKGIILICPDQAPMSIIIRKHIHVLQLPPACGATFQHFHLPPCYKSHQMMIIISLNTANLNTVNISSLEFWVSQHLEDHWNKSQLHTLADVTTVPVAHLYKHMINTSGPILLFNLADKPIDDTVSIWTLFLT